MKPAVSLVAVAGRRRPTLELARRLEHEGFTGIYCPSPGDGLALCEALALVTNEIPFGTSIAHIYTRHSVEYAQTAAVIHELSGGRFRFGIGVSHGPAHERLGLRPGKPLEDIRKFVAEVSSATDMVPTCVDPDRAAAAAVMRKTLTSYVKLPNYQNYWIEAGYAEEMAAIRTAIARRDDAAVQAAMSDRWLSDVTLFGNAKAVRDGVEAWQATGVKTVIIVPSSTRGGQMVAFEELIAAYR
jgi:alkanesulfonate monooxygenase SsuD/methylene tetrahydromethanopterin reductase-like flavin-dependent oxidoreductase (luciferase family)